MFELKRLSAYLFSLLAASATFISTSAQTYWYEIGVGKSKITDGARKPILQGFADSSQKSAGVHDEIYARAFVIKHTTSTAVITVLDNWSATDKIKREVINRVARTDMAEENLLLTATHSHAAPGGYSDWRLYEQTPGGYDKHNFECVVSGTVSAINDAFANLAQGNIYVTEGEVANAPGRQRSAAAYNNNPSSERNQYASDVDTTMLLLKLTQKLGGGEETVGVINWHPIHPTNLGQDYRKVSGDNKGYAEEQLEQSLSVVAAFANSNAGDVSGNVFHGVPTGKSNSELEDIVQSDGNVQFQAAQQLVDIATSQLSGGLDYRYTRVDMGNTPIDDVPGEETLPGGIGLSFAAGSKEDGIPRINIGGTTLDSFNLREGITAGPTGNIDAGELIIEGTIILAMALEFGVVPDQSSFVNGHLPKPLILRTGIFDPPLTPNVVPLQIIKIGDLAIVAVPGEPTTMAGRRIRQTVQNELGVSHVVVAGYSNEYASYITTKEEYEFQHYEGASTLFGPYTLMAYQQEYKKLAQALNSGLSVSPGAQKSTPSVPNMYRVTIRNKCNSNVKVQFYNDGDGWMWVSLDGTHTIPANTDYAYIVGTTQKKRMRIKSSGKKVRGIKDGDLVTINSDCGSGTRGSYTPYHEASF